MFVLLLAFAWFHFVLMDAVTLFVQRVSPVERLVRDAPWTSSPSYRDGQIMFCIRANVTYNGDKDEAPPAFGKLLKFCPNDVMQVVKVLSEEWWLARLFGDGPECGVIPSPKHFLTKLGGANSVAPQAPIKRRSSLANVVTRLGSFISGGSETELAIPEADEAGGPTAGKLVGNAETLGKTLLNFASHSSAHTTPAMERPHPHRPVYDIAPRIRPLVFVGPAKLGSPVTDKLQLALINYLRLTFPGMTGIAPVHTWPVGNNKFRRGGFRPLLGSAEREQHTSSHHMTDATLLFDKEDLNFSKKHASKFKLPIFQIDPEELQAVRNSSLMPVIVMIKIADVTVLSKLIREYGEGNTDTSDQLKSAELLGSMRPEDFDLVLNQSSLDRCCYELSAFVDMFLGETTFEPVIDPQDVMSSPAGSPDRKRKDAGARAVAAMAGAEVKAEWSAIKDGLQNQRGDEDFEGLEGFGYFEI
jgi:hypothetical protein